MNKVEIALLDTGINALHPYLKDNIVKSYEVVYLDKTYQVVPSEDMNNDFSGHGTACASVIKKECSDVELYSFKVFDNKGRCNLQVLETALYYIKSMSINLINLSLAIIDKVDITDLEKLCNDITFDRKIIISSLGNKQKRSYPAVLKECIGVQGSILNTVDSIWFNKHKKIQCVVDNTPFLHCNIAGNYSLFGKCNSYSSAKLTGIVASIISEKSQLSRNQILTCLSDRSEKKYWCQFDLRKSKRYPNIDEYKEQFDKSIIDEIEKIIKKQLNIDKDIPIKNKFLLSSEIGLSYRHCYELIKNIEKTFGITIHDYTRISREDFYSVNHIVHLIYQYMLL